ncbi:protein transport protein SEC24, partial [Lecanoromycetidae sp. Uapishka_2]
MATPQQGYPQPGYEQHQQEQYDSNQQDPPQTASPVQGGPPQQSAKDRRKRQYAGQAYDFGGGANSALGGQQQGGGQYPGPPGYGQQSQQPGPPAPGYGSGPASPTPMGGPAYGQQHAAIGGYQSPETGYPTQGVPPPQPGNMAGITQGMGNMAMGGVQQHRAPQMQGRPQMNQLYPSDLLSQPLNVSELDHQPPPIVLPPNVSIDMFLFSSTYTDVASLSNLPRYTGGQTYFYPGWNAARSEDAIKFAREFSDYLSAEIGLEAVLRVRATTGLRMSTFYGNFFNRSSDLCAFPAFPRDQGYVVEVAIDESLTKGVVCLQAAVLHTTCNGERRIRVMTLALPTTQSLADVYASADQAAITTTFSHKAVERALGSGIEPARDALKAKLVELLQTYRKELAGGNMGGGGLQFPINLRCLPVLFLGLTKNIGLRHSAQIPSDMRSAALCQLSTLPLPLLIQFIYPKFYSLHDMPDSAGVPDETTGDIVLPPPLNLSSQCLVPYGLYLIDDGQTQFLWVGKEAVPQLVEDVFGVPDRTQLKVGKTSVPVLENDFNERVRAVVDKSRDHRSKGVGSIVVPNMYVVREDGEPQMRLWAQSMLVEDRADQGVALAQWLGNLRDKV